MAELPAFSTIEYAKKGEKVSSIGILSAMAKCGYAPRLEAQILGVQYV